LKFKVEASAGKRRRELRAEIEARCQQLTGLLSRDWPELEAYLELEIYSARSRRYWPDRLLSADWEERLPFRDGDLLTAIPPCDEAEAQHSQLSLDAVKHADLHVKIAPALSREVKDRIAERFVAAGFYRVVTWAGNDVLTAQFARGADARRCFQRLVDFFSEAGGCAEITMEPVASVWRSRSVVDGRVRLGALPPLVSALV
jgi:hypothetical protein